MISIAFETSSQSHSTSDFSNFNLKTRTSRTKYAESDILTKLCKQQQCATNFACIITSLVTYRYTYTYLWRYVTYIISQLINWNKKLQNFKFLRLANFQQMLVAGVDVCMWHINLKYLHTLCSPIVTRTTISTHLKLCMVYSK